MTQVLFKFLAFVLLLYCLAANPALAQKSRTELRPEVWAALKTMTGIQVKNKADDVIQLIVLFDPNCPHCATLWQRLYDVASPYQKIASLWVPVSYMRKDSDGKAAFLLEKKSKEALAQNFTGFDFQHRLGAAPVIALTPTMRPAIDRNMSFWSKLLQATPILLFRTKDQRVFSQIGLLPQEQLSDMLKSIAFTTLEQY